MSSFDRLMKDAGASDSHLRRYHARKVSMEYVTHEYRFSLVCAIVGILAAVCSWHFEKNGAGFFFTVAMLAFPMSLWELILAIWYHRIVRYRRRKIAARARKNLR